MSDKLEEQAREILRKLFPCDFTSIPDYDRDRAWLTALLRSVAEDARREEREQCLVDFRVYVRELQRDVAMGVRERGAIHRLRAARKP